MPQMIRYVKSRPHKTLDRKTPERPFDTLRSRLV